MPNRKFEDYELYVNVAEEDEFLLATNGEEFEEKEMESATISNKGMSAVAHYIMVHYAKKELIKKRKKKYKPKDEQYTLDAGLRKFGDEGELSWKCRRYVATCRRRHTVSLQFWPDGSVSPTLFFFRCCGSLCRLEPTFTRFFGIRM